MGLSVGRWRRGVESGRGGEGDGEGRGEGGGGGGEVAGVEGGAREEAGA